MKNQKIRLTQNTLPRHYQISLKIDFSKQTFFGREQISISIKKPTNEITLHAVSLQIPKAHLVFDGRELKSKKIKFDSEAETVTFIFNEKVKASEALLDLSFEGRLTEKLHGLYLSHYQKNGVKKYLATTQFESTYARQAFPCFDEPALKAIFEVDISAPKGKKIISNTEPAKEGISLLEQEKGFQRVFFNPTPVMSTYLLAFIIGDFEAVQAQTDRGVTVRVFAVRGKKQQCIFALKTAIKVLDYFEKYFAIKYPLEALNLIAIPDFSAGAMENWGAITFRETAVLVDSKHTALANKQYVALVVAHEIAHQWFGNLVTMEWWSDLWLNEGFANYAEYLAIDHIYPEWKIWNDFLNGEYSTALRADSLENTHPIEIEINHPKEIDEAFDGPISYAKSASIIRMLSEYIGARNFRAGLRFYLKKHSYSNTETADLWSALTQISGLPIANFISQWTTKPGYPILNVAEFNGKVAKISQRKFYAIRKKHVLTGTGTLWQVPLQIKTPGHNRVSKKTLTEKSIFISSNDILKLNTGETGFYRVNYEGKYFEQIEKALSTNKFDLYDRFGLLNDNFALAEAGEIPITKFLDLLKHFTAENDYNIWSEIAGDLAVIANVIGDRPYAPKFYKFANKIINPKLQELGFEKKKGESHGQTFLRNILLGTALRFENRNVAKALRPNFKKLISGFHTDPDLRGMTYLAAAMLGDNEEYRLLEKHLEKTNLQEERARIMRALGGFDQAKLAEKTLKRVLSTETRDQDRIMLFAAVMSNRKNRTAGYRFFKTNWKKIYQKYNREGHEIGAFIGLNKVFSSKEIAKDLEKFFKQNKAPGYRRSINLTIERISANATLLQREDKQIHDWLKKQD